MDRLLRNLSYNDFRLCRLKHTFDLGNPELSARYYELPGGVPEAMSDGRNVYARSAERFVY